jgi:hypothetical protein
MTAPKKNSGCLVFLLCMIIIKYDPYSKIFSREYYEIEKMHKIRQQSISIASKAKKIGIILGTLGRQGSPKVFECHFQHYFSYIMAVSFIGGGNWSTRKKQLTCRKSLTNFIT